MNRPVYQAQAYAKRRAGTSAPPFPLGVDMKRTLVILIAGAAVVGSAAVAASLLSDSEPTVAEAAAEEPAPTPVSVAAAGVGPVAVRLATTSAIEAERTAQVLSETSGVVTGILVGEGQRVAEGAVLAHVDARDRRLSFEQAELRLSRAEAELSRQRRAFEQDLVAEYEYEKARFDRDLAASERETARLELERTEIRAPFAGTITELAVVAGARLEPAQHLLTLADFDTLIARLYIPERDVAGLVPGQRARIHPESDPRGAGRDGAVREIGPVVDRSTGTVKVTVAIPHGGGGAVRPGSFARVVIETGVRENAVLTPKRAVMRGNGQSHVFVVENGRAVRRDVTLGAEIEGPSGALLEVAGGLAEGEQVVVAGQGSLAPGAAVEVLNGL